MKSDKVRKWASRNCPYKKFKWHTEDMCKNCIKDAEEIESIMELDRADLVGEVLNEIYDQTLAADEMGFFGRLFGRRLAVLNALDSLKMKVKKIGE